MLEAEATLQRHAEPTAAFGPEQLRPLRRTEYDQLVELGAFRDEHIELLRGQLVAMSPIGSPHSSVVQRLTETVVRALAGRASVRCQLPFAALDDSEPEPDIAVVPPGDYWSDHPDRAYLVIEVAESSLDRDLGFKARLYAEAQVDEYWVVDIPNRRVVVHREPDAGAWRRVTPHDRNATLAPVRFPDAEIRIAGLLLPPET